MIRLQGTIDEAVSRVRLMLTRDIMGPTVCSGKSGLSVWETASVAEARKSFCAIASYNPGAPERGSVVMGSASGLLEDCFESDCRLESIKSFNK